LSLQPAGKAIDFDDCDGDGVIGVIEQVIGQQDCSPRRC
jgi:hypothetical protein